MDGNHRVLLTRERRLNAWTLQNVHLKRQRPCAKTGQQLKNSGMTRRKRLRMGVANGQGSRLSPPPEHRAELRPPPSPFSPFASAINCSLKNFFRRTQGLRKNPEKTRKTCQPVPLSNCDSSVYNKVDKNVVPEIENGPRQQQAYYRATFGFHRNDDGTWLVPSQTSVRRSATWSTRGQDLYMPRHTGRRIHLQDYFRASNSSPAGRWLTGRDRHSKQAGDADGKECLQARLASVQHSAQAYRGRPLARPTARPVP